MTSRELENVAATGQLKRSPIDEDEIAGLTSSGEARLADAARRDLSFESRFDLAYNAAHALAQAALRLAGYRSENRQVVFQALSHTLDMPTGVWRLLAKCHGLRNRAEYEGMMEVDELLVEELIEATRHVRDELRARKE